MEEMQYLQMLEAILVQHRAFGDSDYLHEQLQVCYKRRLTKISARLPAAGALLDTLCLRGLRDRSRELRFRRPPRHNPYPNLHSSQLAPSHPTGRTFPRGWDDLSRESARGVGRRSLRVVRGRPLGPPIPSNANPA